MFCTLILVAVLLCAAARAEECKGGWTRADAHLCVLRNLDQINDDGKIDAQEISQFKKKLISSATLLGSFGGWLEGQVEKILPHDWLAKYSTAEIQSRCADEEGYITMHSWEAKREHCINRCGTKPSGRSQLLKRFIHSIKP